MFESWDFDYIIDELFKPREFDARVVGVIGSWAFVSLCGLFATIYIMYDWFTSAEQFDVDRKTCVVTGGSQGLGLAVSQELAKRGANVVIVARDKAKLERALNEVKVRIDV